MADVCSSKPEFQRNLMTQNYRPLNVWMYLSAILKIVCGRYLLKCINFCVCSISCSGIRKQWLSNTVGDVSHSDGEQTAAMSVINL